jgi:purine-binding chemotaxis protein CheW
MSATATDRIVHAHPHDPDVDDYIDALLAPMEAATQPAPAGTAPPVPHAASAGHARLAEADTQPPAAVPLREAAPPSPAAPAAVSRPAADTTDDGAPATPKPQPARWLRVSIDGDRYAVELLRVQEVVRMAPIVAMRGATPAVLGVMNLRGRIVPVWDLGRWLGAGEVHPDERARIVVVERDDELIGVLVTSVDDVVSFTPDAIEPPYRPSVHKRRAADRATLGVARPGAVPTVLLDANALFE